VTLTNQNHLKKKTGGLKEMLRKTNSGLKISKTIGKLILSNRQNFIKKKRRNLNVKLRKLQEKQKDKLKKRKDRQAKVDRVLIRTFSTNLTKIQTMTRRD